MKKSLLSFLTLSCFFALAANAQSVADSTGLLGDNFSLEGALECFKSSQSLEDFEQKLNSEDQYTNNLDLNGDGEIDFVKVIDNMEGDHHAIVLQVDINQEESQDIAVIEIEKTGDENAILQIVGDTYLYGPDKYVEPFENETELKGKGPDSELVFTGRLVVNVWLWPSVRYIYRPGYRPYISPWRWSYYPSYWKPWRPHPWRWHFNKRSRFSIHYHSVSTHRVVRAHRIYTPKRRSSTIIKTKSASRKVVVKKGNRKAVKSSKAKVTSNKTNKKASRKSKKSVRKSNTGKKSVRKSQSRSVRKKKG